METDTNTLMTYCHLFAQIKSHTVFFHFLSNKSIILRDPVSGSFHFFIENVTAWISLPPPFQNPKPILTKHLVLPSPTHSPFLTESLKETDYGIFHTHTLTYIY